MTKLLKILPLALCLAALAMPAFAQQRAYAPENLRTLSQSDQERVIRLEYSEQSNGRRIPDEQLRFYLDQVNRSSWGFSKIKADIAKSLASTGPQPGTGGTIRCESVDGRSQACPTPWPNSSRLVRQLSQAHCTEGRTWQTRQGLVSVSGGCRGEFAAALMPGPGTGIVRCESDGNRSRTCRTPWPGPSRLVRQLSQSPCDEGRTWQSQQGQVYVGNGCRAEFAAATTAPPSSAATIRCESTGSRYNACNTPWRDHSRLVRQLSSADCTEDRNWGSSVGQVWVSNGCRAEFMRATGTPVGYTVTCESSGNLIPTVCAWDDRKGSPYLQEQLSSAPCIEKLNWGYKTGLGLWVSAGCRARFASRAR